MYAIIQTGGKQYRVTEGQTVKVEKLPIEVGKAVNFTDVLMVTHGDDVHIGVPYVKDAEVTAEVLETARGRKIEIIKLKRRKHHLKHQGHRQAFTAVKITSISVGGKKLAKPAAAAEKPAKAKAKTKKPTKKTSKKAAPKQAKTAKAKTTKKATKKSAKKVTRKSTQSKK